MVFDFLANALICHEGNATEIASTFRNLEVPGGSPGAIFRNDLPDLVGNSTLLYLFGTMLLWWFGSDIIPKHSDFVAYFCCQIVCQTFCAKRFANGSATAEKQISLESH